jgi:hypothetical protein
MIKKYGMNKNICNDILEDSSMGEIDNSTFMLWKSELQKELPLFWQSIECSKNNYDQDIISKNDILS